MDDCKPPDTNVVRLRRKGYPCEEERKQIARTIFAAEDDVGPFSRGTLPRRGTTRRRQQHRARPVLREPEAIDGERSGERTTAQVDATAAYFEDLGSQTSGGDEREHRDAAGGRDDARQRADARRAPTRHPAASSQAHRDDSVDFARARLSVRDRARLSVPALAATLSVLVVAGVSLAAAFAGPGGSATAQRPPAAAGLTATRGSLLTSLSKRAQAEHPGVTQEHRTARAPTKARNHRRQTHRTPVTHTRDRHSDRSGNRRLSQTR